MQRDYRVDVIKFIGTLLVILAHCIPNDLVFFHVRTFDVVLLVFASGLTLKFHGDGIKDYLHYIYKRIVRLAVPAWIFTVIYYCISAIMRINNSAWDFSASDVVQSFIFIGGIGNLWIIRVYLSQAVICPALFVISNSKFYRKFWPVIIAMILALNEIVAIFSENSSTGIIGLIVKAIIVYTVGYAVVELIAVSIDRIGNFRIFAFTISAFMIIWCSSGFISPNTMKYPPRALYILYGIVVSVLIYIILTRFREHSKLISNKSKILGGGISLIVWISKNTLWIYLWHILVLAILNREISITNWFMKYLLTLLLSMVITFFQNIVITHEKIGRKTK